MGSALMRSGKVLTAGAGIFGAFLTTAVAADLPPIYSPPIYQDVPELVPVEVGSGWYLRGDVSYQFESDLEEFRYEATDGFAVYSGDYDGARLKLDEGFGFGGGVGYYFTDFLRADVTANYWKTDLNHDSIFDSSEYGAELEAWEVMANAYVDLGTFVGLTPYVGGGLGAVHTSYDIECSVDGTACDDLFGVETSGSSDWRFAYSLMAGVAYDLTRNLKIDVGYRYLNVDGGDVLSIEGPGLARAGVSDDGFDRHTIQAGIRYSIF